MRIPVLATSARLVALCMAIAPNIAEGDSVRELHFTLSVIGGNRPTFIVASDLADGAEVQIVLHTPWAPDAQGKLRAGFPACDPDCWSPMSLEPIVRVAGGRVVAGPFTYDGRSLPQGVYQFEVYLMDDLRRLQSDEEWRAAFVSQVTVR